MGDRSEREPGTDTITHWFSLLQLLQAAFLIYQITRSRTGYGVVNFVDSPVFKNTYQSVHCVSTTIVCGFSFLLKYETLRGELIGNLTTFVASKDTLHCSCQSVCKLSAQSRMLFALRIERLEY